MKPTPTHPVPDLDRALETLLLCAKGFFFVNIQSRDVYRGKKCASKGTIMGTPGGITTA